MEAAMRNLVLSETINEGVKNHVTITFRVHRVIEEYGADYSISLYGASHQATEFSFFLDVIKIFPVTNKTWGNEYTNSYF